MHYEIHVTVNTVDRSKFIDDCKEMGVKPIIIEVENNSNFEQQVMTSAKYTGDDFKEKLNELCKYLNEKEYKILRKKVEIKPEETKNPGFIYYETHFRLKLALDFNRSKLIDFCKENNVHLSKNLFKKASDFVYQMITYRDSKMTYQEFLNKVESIMVGLDKLNIIYDKVEIEEAIFDSNINIDNSWLNTKK